VHRNPFLPAEKNKTIIGISPVLRMYEETCLRSLGFSCRSDRLRSDARRSFESGWRRRSQCTRD
jgi:hypothetical protein